MGLQFLGGSSWAEVTREERFFCSRLYELIRPSPREFVGYINRSVPLNLPTEADWEAAFEVCFYRDLWHHRGRRGRPVSEKRTFDLCLFSDVAIVVIEGKAYQGFDGGQLRLFEKEREWIRRETSVDRVVLTAIISSHYTPRKQTEDVFDGILRWADVSRFFHEDTVLLRADEIYQLKATATRGAATANAP